jgi:predicted O-methyltransferase YrrM
MLLQIPRTTGEFLEWLVPLAPRSGKIIELGTSAGYSSLWITLGLNGGRRVLETFEANPYKIERARKTFHAAGVQDRVRQHAAPRRSDFQAIRIAFCFLDTYKESYLPLARLVVPRMLPGAILAADNAVSHHIELEQFLRWCHAQRRLDVMELPMDSGLLLARRLG